MGCSRNDTYCGWPNRRLCPRSSSLSRQLHPRAEHPGPFARPIFSPHEEARWCSQASKPQQAGIDQWGGPLSFSSPGSSDTPCGVDGMRGYWHYWADTCQQSPRQGAEEKWVQEEIVQADRVVPRTRGCAVTNVLIILDIATTSQHRPQFFTAFMRSGARIWDKEQEKTPPRSHDRRNGAEGVVCHELERLWLTGNVVEV